MTKRTRERFDPKRLDAEFGFSRQKKVHPYVERILSPPPSLFVREDDPYYLVCTVVSSEAAVHEMMYISMYALLGAVYSRASGVYVDEGNKSIHLGSCDPRLGLVIGKKFVYAGPVGPEYPQLFQTLVPPTLINEQVPLIPQLFKMLALMRAVEKHVAETKGKPFMRILLVCFADCTKETCTDREMADFARELRASKYDICCVDVSEEYVQKHPKKGELFGACPPNRRARAWLSKLGAPERDTFSRMLINRREPIVPHIMNIHEHLGYFW